MRMLPSFTNEKKNASHWFDAHSFRTAPHCPFALQCRVTDPKKPSGHVATLSASAATDGNVTSSSVSSGHAMRTQSRITSPHCPKRSQRRVTDPLVPPGHARCTYRVLSAAGHSPSAAQLHRPASTGPHSPFSSQRRRSASPRPSAQGTRCTSPARCSVHSTPSATSAGQRMGRQRPATYSQAQRAEHQ